MEQQQQNCIFSPLTFTNRHFGLQIFKITLFTPTLIPFAKVMSSLILTRSIYTWTLKLMIIYNMYILLFGQIVLLTSQQIGDFGLPTYTNRQF